MANPLLNRARDLNLPQTAQAWADRGNAHLAEIARRDVHWIVRDGRCVIEWATRGNYRT